MMKHLISFYIFASLITLYSSTIIAQEQKSLTTDSLRTKAGDLKIVEVEEFCKYSVTLNDRIIFKTDCKDESNKYYMEPIPTIHTYYKSLSEGIAPFDEVILFQQQMLGNACNGRTLQFLGLKLDGSYLLSNTIDFCGGRQPIITWGDNKVTLLIPGGPPNRGTGYIPTETWIYEKGVVRQVPTNRRRK